MTEQEHRERAQEGEFLTDEEWAKLTEVEQLLYPVAYKHWDIAMCHCPLCNAWRALRIPAEHRARKLRDADAAKGQRHIVLETESR